MSYARGLPQLVIPLPSRRERCLFSMRPITNNVGDLIQQIRQEDHGIDRVVLTTTGITDPAGLCWLLSGKEGGREGGRAEGKGDPARVARGFDGKGNSSRGHLLQDLIRIQLE